MVRPIQLEFPFITCICFAAISGKGDCITVLLAYFGEADDCVPRYFEDCTNGFLCQKPASSTHFQSQFNHDRIDWLHFLFKRILKRKSTVLDIYGSGKCNSNSSIEQYSIQYVSPAELIEEAAARGCDVISLQRKKPCLEYISDFLNSIDSTQDYIESSEEERDDEETKQNKGNKTTKTPDGEKDNSKKKYPLRNKKNS